MDLYGHHSTNGYFRVVTSGHNPLLLMKAYFLYLIRLHVCLRDAFQTASRGKLFSDFIMYEEWTDELKLIFQILSMCFEFFQKRILRITVKKVYGDESSSAL